jgi:hypothetical protein
MLSRFKDLFTRVRTNLTRLDDQPLGKAALVIILFLDLFILISIFDGLDEHTRQLTSPDEYIPATCRQIVLDREWNPTSRLEDLSAIVLAYRSSYYPLEREHEDLHPVCRPYIELLDRIKKDKGLSDAFEDRSGFVREATDLRREIQNLKGAYDTSLLEAAAGKEEGKAQVGIIQKQVREKTTALNTLTGQILSLDQRINGDATIRQLWDLLGRLRDLDRDSLRADLRRQNFWFPVKRLAMQLVFLLPLLAAFYFWNGASIRKGRGVQTLVSSHLLVVAAIPVLFKIIETVYDIIPKKLLRKLIELLESLKLVAIWHYLMIALAVAGALFLIYIFQKKIFSREKMLERRIAKGQCQVCGKQLPAPSPACPFCGASQFKACGTCGKQTLVHGKFCRECGAPQDKG